MLEFFFFFFSILFLPIMAKIKKRNERQTSKLVTDAIPIIISRKPFHNNRLPLILWTRPKNSLLLNSQFFCKNFTHFFLSFILITTNCKSRILIKLITKKKVYYSVNNLEATPWRHHQT